MGLVDDIVSDEQHRAWEEVTDALCTFWEAMFQLIGVCDA